MSFYLTLCFSISVCVTNTCRLSGRWSAFSLLFLLAFSRTATVFFFMQVLTSYYGHHFFLSNLKHLSKGSDALSVFVIILTVYALVFPFHCLPATNIPDTVCTSLHPLFFIHLIYFPFLFTYLSNCKFFRVRMMNTCIYICIFISVVCLYLVCVFINSGHSACAVTTMHIGCLSPQIELP